MLRHDVPASSVNYQTVTDVASSSLLVSLHLLDSLSSLDGSFPSLAVERCPSRFTYRLV